MPADSFTSKLKEKNILAIPIGKNQVRMVTHLDIDDSGLEIILNTLKNISI
jgi:threonine aldolase